MVQTIFILLLSVCIVFELGAGQSFNAPSPNCKSFSCKGGKNYLAVPKGKTKYKSSGCKSNGISMFDVNQMQGRKDPVTECCDLRTACFSICGISFKFCEKEFEKCSATVCHRELDPSKKEACTRSANLYKMTMKLGGCKNFNDLQQANCDCVIGESRLEKKRLKALSTFYKKHKKEFANDNEKLKNLVKKHGVNNNKFAKLIYKMVRKYYPKSISVVMDPQQKMYEEILKQSKQKSSHSDDDSKQNQDVHDETETLDGARPSKKDTEEDFATETIEIKSDGDAIETNSGVHNEDASHDNDDDMVIDLDDE